MAKDCMLLGGGHLLEVFLVNREYRRGTDNAGIQCGWLAVRGLTSFFVEVRDHHIDKLLDEGNIKLALGCEYVKRKTRNDWNELTLILSGRKTKSLGGPSLPSSNNGMLTDSL